MKFEYVLYPCCCGFCGKLLDEKYICDDCKSKLPYVKNNYIKINAKTFFDEFICIYKYEGIVRKRILEYKFNNKTYLCNTFAEVISDIIIERDLKFDVVIPVPISFFRYIERGYNQCLLICEKISKRICVKSCNNVLIKIKNNKRQSELRKMHRMKNVIGAYKVKNIHLIKNKKILLVDDIFTTGSTVNECSKVLKNAGAKEIIVMTIAKGENYG